MQDKADTSNETLADKAQGALNSVWEKLAGFDLSVNEDPLAYGPTGDCGFPRDRTDVSDYYIVEIKSDTMKRTVRALLQSNFTTSVRSTWAEGTFSNVLSKFTREVVQGATSGYAVGSQFLTRRIWHGSSPMHLQIKLKFESIGDAYKEVVVPCGTLEQMALPAKFKFATENRNVGHTIAENAMIVPPGPNPFYVDPNAVKEHFSWASGFLSRRAGDIITISIGKLMSFKSVIVRDVEVVWGRKFTKQGNPISAEATVHFESFEIYTKEDIYQEVFQKSSQTLSSMANSGEVSDYMSRNELFAE